MHAHQDKGLAAMERLDKSLDNFRAMLDEKGKQDVLVCMDEFPET